MKRTKDILDKLLESYYYIALVAIINFLAWIFGIPLIAIIPYALISVYILLFTDRIENFLVIIMFMIMLKSPYNDGNTSFPVETAFFYSTIAIPLIYYVYKNFEKKFNFNFLIGFIAIVAAYLLSYISLIGKGEFNAAVIGTMTRVPLYVLLYIISSLYIKGDLRRFFSYTMLIMGLLIVVETFIVEMASELPLSEPKDYGWTYQNGAAQVLVLSIAYTVYLACTSKYSMLYLILIALQGSALIVTFSRGGLLAIGLISIPLLVVLILNLPQKRYLLIALPAVSIVFIPGLVDQMLNMVLNEGTSDGGRLPLYELAIDFFLENPLFGRTSLAFVPDIGDSTIGIYHIKEGSTFTNMNFHNTFLHFIATMGILGGIALMIHIGEVFKKVSSHKDLFMVITVIALIGINIHGMIDILYFKRQMMCILMVFFAIIDNAYPKNNYLTAWVVYLRYTIFLYSYFLMMNSRCDIFFILFLIS